MTKPQEQYEKETGKQWWINPVCHGELGYASWDYQLWLEDKVTNNQIDQFKPYIYLHTEEFNAWLNKYFEISDEPHYKAKYDQKLFTLKQLYKKYEKAFKKKLIKS